MTFSWRGDMTYTLQLGPFPALEIEGPNVIIMILPVCTTKSRSTVSLLKLEYGNKVEQTLSIGLDAEHKYGPCAEQAVPES